METQKGICRLSIVPVRSGPSDPSEQVTQLLFGEHYEVLGKNDNGKWVRIRIAYDSYEGWIDHRQHTPISDEFFHEIDNSNYQVSLEPVSEVEISGVPRRLVMGSVLPVTSSELFAESLNLKFSGSARTLAKRENWDFIKQIAFTFLGSPYQWGGRTHFGIDCSGFSQIVYRLAGYGLKRDASQQIGQGRSVSFQEYLPGDLAFFQSPSGKISHVGIMLEDGGIIHASGQVRIDKITEEGIVATGSGEKTHSLVAIRRILKSS